MIVRGEALCQLDTLSDEVGITTPEHLKSIVLGLGTYFLPGNTLSKQNHAMRREMMNTRGLKLRLYAARMIYLTKYLAALNGAKASEKCFDTELKEMFLNSMYNSRIS